MVGCGGDCVAGDAAVQLVATCGVGRFRNWTPVAGRIRRVDVGTSSNICTDHAGVTVDGDAVTELALTSLTIEFSDLAPVATSIGSKDVGIASIGVGSPCPDHAGTTVDGDAVS